jgi:hypothetical protein
MSRYTTNVGYEMCDYTSNNCGHMKSNSSFNEKYRSHTRKTLNLFTTKDSYTWNITRHTERTAA